MAFMGAGVVVVVGDGGGGGGEGQGTTSCVDPAAMYPGHVALHPIGKHVTAPFLFLYEQLVVAVPAVVP